MMPPAVITVIYSSNFGLDSETAATLVTIGTVLLLPVVPLLPALLSIWSRAFQCGFNESLSIVNRRISMHISVLAATLSIGVYLE